MICTTKDCGADIEASVPLWLSLDANDEFHTYGIGDEAAKITCENGHDNTTQELADKLTRYIEAFYPGASWRDTDPRRI